MPHGSEFATCYGIPRAHRRRRCQHLADGGLDEDLAAIDRQLDAVSDNQSRVLLAIAAVDDDEAAVALLAEAKELDGRKFATNEDREEVLLRIADRDTDD